MAQVYQVPIKDNRVLDVELCLERAIDMPMTLVIEGPEKPNREVPMFSNTKALVEWWLGEQLKRVAKRGDDLLKTDTAPFNTDFLEKGN